MTTAGTALLERLEYISAQTKICLEPSTFQPDVLEVTGPLLAERGELMAELALALARDNSVTYAEFNRLLTIHGQGGEIASSLESVRTALCSLKLEAQRQRAYADCLQKLVRPAVGPRSEVL